MGVILSPESAVAKELARFDGPYVYREYPRALYMARRHKSGQWRVLDPEDEAFSAGSIRYVKNDAELERALADGWRRSTREALDYREALEQEIARAAAERHFADQRLSAKAQAEAKAADEATDAHVADIPAPKKRGGWRPRKPPPDGPAAA